MPYSRHGCHDRRDAGLPLSGAAGNCPAPTRTHAPSESNAISETRAPCFPPSSPLPRQSAASVIPSAKIKTTPGGAQCALECGDSSPLLAGGGAGGEHPTRSALQPKAAMNRRTPRRLHRHPRTSPRVRLFSEDGMTTFSRPCVEFTHRGWEHPHGAGLRDPRPVPRDRRESRARGKSRRAASGLRETPRTPARGQAGDRICGSAKTCGEGRKGSAASPPRRGVASPVDPSCGECDVFTEIQAVLNRFPLPSVRFMEPIVPNQKVRPVPPSFPESRSPRRVVFAASWHCTALDFSALRGNAPGGDPGLHLNAHPWH